jgi:hypothetical protein
MNLPDRETVHGFKQEGECEADIIPVNIHTKQEERHGDCEGQAHIG